jgi:uncharacterized protein (TIGR03382 family)
MHSNGWRRCVRVALIAFGVLSGCHSVEEQERVSHSTQGLTCGVERWSVKTGTDPDAIFVNRQPQDATLAMLASFSPPASLPANGRVAPYEQQVYRLTGVMLTKYKLETDSDYHLIISDGSQTMIAEIADPGCLGSTNPFLPYVQNARTSFDSRFSAMPFFQNANVTATLEGVGFFDFLHGQTGVAANGFELHPVTGLCFGDGCRVREGDAGLISDGGVDGGIPDASAPGGGVLDSGLAVDSNAMATEFRGGGCGCASASASPMVCIGLLVGLALFRRVRLGGDADF